MTFVAFISGQLFFAAVADSTGLLGVTLRPMTPVRGAGLALTALGAILVHVAGGRANKLPLPPAER